MHLFAGIGGGLLADLILGHKPIIAVEWDKYACRVLRERAADGWFPDLSVWEGDIRLFNPSEYTGRVDCIHAGFPCQDISVAGKQAGLGEGTRSGLYREVLRIAGVVRPRYLFLENVSAILSNGLGCVLGDLAAMGYDCRWLCIRASDVGAPHGRDRWFALAIRNTEHYGHPSEQELRGNEAPSNQRRQEESQQAKQLAGTGRPIDVPSIRGCEIRGERQSSEQHEDVAYTNGIGCLYGKPKEQPAESRVDAQRNIASGSEDVADTQRNGLQRERQDWNAKGQVGLCGGARCDEEQDVCHSSSAGLPDRAGKPMERSGEKQKFERPGWWATQSEVGQLAHGVSNRVGMLKGLGNAQVPLQAAAAWRLLTNMEHTA